MDDEDRRKQAEVLAAIARLPEGTTIEEWNARRLIIISPEKQWMH
jgi:hypothetical protein